MLHLNLTVQQKENLQKRRQRLGHLLDQNQVGLIASGHPCGRNYEANPYYPFRASSHFLYLTALNIPHAIYLIDQTGGSLYLPRPTIDDDLWHGASPSFEEISTHLGCPVFDLQTLPHHLKGRSVQAIPHHQTSTQSQFCQLLNRLPNQKEDLHLINSMIHLRLIQ